VPTFSTPQPIALMIELVVGDVRITATDRTDTVVDIRPSDGSREPDINAAEQTRVEFSGGRLLIKAPKQRGFGLFGRTGSVDVTVELPSGSQLDGDASVGAFRAAGRLGDCRIATSTGEVRLGSVGTLQLNTGAGAVDVDRIAGDADVRTGSGKISLPRIDGNAVVKNSDGDCWVGQISGDVRVKTADGGIRVDRAGGNITAATADGSIRIGEIARGLASFKTAFGEIEFGVAAGSAARLDVHTSFGRVHNHLTVADRPEPSDETIAVDAHTSYGDITIRRARAATK